MILFCFCHLVDCFVYSRLKICGHKCKSHVENIHVKKQVKLFIENHVVIFFAFLIFYQSIDA
jgi:hypothetical protein